MTENKKVEKDMEEKKPAFIDYRGTEEAKMLEGLGLKLCSKCGSKKLTDTENKVVCANNLPDCPLLSI